MSGRIVSQLVIFPKSFSFGDDIFRQNRHDALDPNCVKTYILDLDCFAHPASSGRMLACTPKIKVILAERKAE